MCSAVTVLLNQRQDVPQIIWRTIAFSKVIHPRAHQLHVIYVYARIRGIFANPRSELGTFYGNRDIDSKNGSLSVKNLLHSSCPFQYFLRWWLVHFYKPVSLTYWINLFEAVKIYVLHCLILELLVWSISGKIWNAKYIKLNNLNLYIYIMHSTTFLIYLNEIDNTLIDNWLNELLLVKSSYLYL